MHETMYIYTKRHSLITKVWGKGHYRAEQILTNIFYMSYLNQTCMNDNLNCIIATILHITFTLTLTDVFPFCKSIINVFSMSLIL